MKQNIKCSKRSLRGILVKTLLETRVNCVTVAAFLYFAVAAVFDSFIKLFIMNAQDTAVARLLEAIN